LKVLLVYNTNSGRGRARGDAARIEQTLARSGHSVRTLQLGTKGWEIEPSSAFAASDAAVVIGGDGTVHAASLVAPLSSTPLYHFPTGTENLFARAFGMSRSIPALLAALTHPRVIEIDSARCNDRSFIIMCSAGPDAGVIHRLSRHRNGSITHLSYLPHILAEAARPSIAPLSIEADGRRILDARPGLAVVANIDQYAMRINPASRASPTDGLLDVVFFPAASVARLVGWGLRARSRLPIEKHGALYTRASHVRILSHDRPVPYQLDGEAPGHDGAASPRAAFGAPGFTPLEVSVCPRSLRVLLPPGSASA